MITTEILKREQWELSTSYLIDVKWLLIDYITIKKIGQTQKYQTAQ